MILTVIAGLIWPNQDYSLPKRRVRNNEPAIWKGMVDIAINNGRNTIATGIPINDSTIMRRLRCNTARYATTPYPASPANKINASGISISHCRLFQLLR